MSKRNYWVGIGLMATVLMTGAVAQASESPRITASTDVKPVNTLSAEESQAMSLAAGRILLHTDRARQAIARKDKKAALHEIEQGLTLVKIIEGALPRYKVITEIKSGDTVYKTEEEVSNDYVPVFNEQYIEDIIVPVVQEKRKSHAARMKQQKHAAKKGKRHHAAMEEFSMWRLSSMKLDIRVAADALALAKNELESDRMKAADAALAALQSEGVIFEFDEVELPLSEAADNLKLAELEVDEGRISAARATLKLVSDDLKRYARMVGESRAEEVRELQEKVDKLIGSLGDEKRASGEAERIMQEIESYWRRVVKWFR